MYLSRAVTCNACKQGKHETAAFPTINQSSRPALPSATTAPRTTTDFGHGYGEIRFFASLFSCSLDIFAILLPIVVYSTFAREGPKVILKCDGNIPGRGGGKKDEDQGRELPAVLSNEERCSYCSVQQLLITHQAVSTNKGQEKVPGFSESMVARSAGRSGLPIRALDIRLAWPDKQANAWLVRTKGKTRKD